MQNSVHNLTRKSSVGSISERKGATFVNNYGLRKVHNPYATKNPTEALHPSERLKLTNRFSLINPKKNVLHVPEEDDKCSDDNHDSVDDDTGHFSN